MIKKISATIMLSLLFASGAQAACKIVNSGLQNKTIYAGEKNPMIVSNIQQAGKVLADTLVTPQEISLQTHIDLEKVLFVCDESDKDKLYELAYRPYGWADNATPAYSENKIQFFKTSAVGVYFQFFLGEGSEYEFLPYKTMKKISSSPSVTQPNKIEVKLKDFSGVRNLQIRSDNMNVPNGEQTIAGVSRGIVGFIGPGINDNLNNSSGVITASPVGESYLNVAQYPAKVKLDQCAQ
ncbi:hypothetical protein JAG76_001524 [Providencia stuartii]|uniref:hypothetical protein n=1 Tax=unclassified Providencia TaxID=2633465 RepID=UPI00234B3F6A|nr:MULTISPECIES: hypothetical protein [unclassified Providencia]ELR5121133.1 hypothetical protein [Providencia stuartii]